MAETLMRIAGEAEKALPKKVNFTVKLLGSLTVPDGKDRVWVYDAKTPHLAYLKTANGASSFYWSGRNVGRPIRLLLGDGSLSIEQARNLAAAATEKDSRNIDLQGEKRGVRAGDSFATVWEVFMTKHVRPNLRTADEIDQKYEKYLRRWDGRKLTAITAADVQALHDEIAKDRPGAASRLVALLKSFFNFCSEPKHCIGYTAKNPASGITIRDVKRERYLTDEELPRFFKGLKSVSQDMRDLFTLALYIGARISNIREMEWSEVDFESRLWNIPEHKFKTKRSVSIPLVGGATEILKRRAKEQGEPRAEYVFPSTGKNGCLQEHKKAWATVCRVGQLTDLHTHDLRHTLGTNLRKAGADLKTIKAMLGHASDQSALRYMHVHVDDVRESAAAAVNAMFKAGKKAGK